MVRVKICGITSWEDAKLAVDEGASALGFNFYPPSPRVISPNVAWDILRRLPPYVDRIGVYVDWQPEVIAALTRALRLTGIQLHGNESPSDVEELCVKAPVVKAFPVKRDFDPESLRKFNRASAILLERFDPVLRGGVGKPWDWRLAREAGRYARIVLAGGLTPENVAEAIDVSRPYAVDVATGLEIEVGKKDPGLVRAFMRAVEQANSKLAEQGVSLQ
jgi:phosphoribosylanthranilate isomerase